MAPKRKKTLPAQGKQNLGGPGIQTFIQHGSQLSTSTGYHATSSHRVRDHVSGSLGVPQQWPQGSAASKAAPPETAPPAAAESAPPAAATDAERHHPTQAPALKRRRSFRVNLQWGVRCKRLAPTSNSANVSVQSPQNYTREKNLQNWLPCSGDETRDKENVKSLHSSNSVI